MAQTNEFYFTQNGGCCLNDVKTVELFAGIGGFRLGLEKASQRYKTVWANEWNKYAAAIYRKNFGEKELYEGDITKVNADDIPDCDLLVGGFPCQPFSLAGERKGFSDIRGTLFFDVARIAERKRPKVLFLENVKGLLSAQNGFCFLTILDTLDELGYNVQWKVLNTKNWLPQTRERVFIIATLREKCRSQVFPFAQIYCISEAESDGESENEEGICSTIDSRYGALRNCGETYVMQVKRTRADGNHMIRTYLNETPTLTSQMGTGGGNIPIVMPCLTPGRESKRQNDRRFKENGEPMFTLTSTDIHGVMIDDEPRYLTERECERLQGFPDDWTLGISRTQRYKCLGNAVSVPVIQYVAQLLLEAF